MIHVVLGTKAQLVKMAPLMLMMQERNIPYNFIFTGQHQETMSDLRENFDLKAPDVVLHTGKDVTSIFAMLKWILKIIWLTVRQRKTIFKSEASNEQIAFPKKQIVLVHGDTFSTLLGALMGKVAGAKVAHIESGLRSFNWFHPFPEELTRLAVFRLAHFYYCPGNWAVENLKKFKGIKINTQFNTLMDSLRHAFQSKGVKPIDLPNYDYCVVTTHRFENIFNRPAFERNLRLIEQIALKKKVVFIMHPVTEKKLREFDLLSRVTTNANIECRPRYDYFQFMKLVHHAEFMVTDGGSNQEECYYMGKPCLLLRNATERQEGLAKTVLLSQYEPEKVDDFLRNVSRFKGENLIDSHSPSSIIVNHLQENGFTQ
jgi:UDP-N-acetylglucosamine 2-epimerase (non-hydrolysing)